VNLRILGQYWVEDGQSPPSFSTVLVDDSVAQALSGGAPLRAYALRVDAPSRPGKKNSWDHCPCPILITGSILSIPFQVSVMNPGVECMRNRPHPFEATEVVRR
jgi:hypothetical protein